MTTKEPIEQQCGIPKGWGFGWVIDEFDSSFDTLAMASLRYHMDHAVTVCEGERRAAYQSLLEEFEEIGSRQLLTPEHIAHEHPEDTEDILAFLRRDCPECDRHHEDYGQARKKRRVDQQAARHKFVDLMPGLWS